MAMSGNSFGVPLYISSLCVIFKMIFKPNLLVVPAPRIQDKLLNLPLPQKIIGIGAVIALIGALLPWYQDIDMFNSGDLFLGVTGPLYLVGYIIIALGLFSIILTGFYLLEKKLPPLPMKESVIYIISGAFSLFLLIIANSVYFHPRFGLNLTSKEYGIGMMLAFVGAVAITIGGVLQHRESGTSRFVKEFQEETQTVEEEVDPVLELNNFQKEQQVEHDKQSQQENEEVPVEQIPVRDKPQTGVREYKAKQEETPEKTKVWQEPYPNPASLRREREAERSSDSEKVNPNSVIRTDL